MIRALLMALALTLASSRSETERCYSRQHQNAQVDGRAASAATPAFALDSKALASEQDCVLTCCSREVRHGAKCNVAVFDGNKSDGEDNCFLYHCPYERDCPLKKAASGVRTYDIFKGLTHPSAVRPVSAATDGPVTGVAAPLANATAASAKRGDKTGKKQNKPKGGKKSKSRPGGGHDEAGPGAAGELPVRLTSPPNAPAAATPPAANSTEFPRTAVTPALRPSPSPARVTLTTTPPKTRAKMTTTSLPPKTASMTSVPRKTTPAPETATPTSPGTTTAPKTASLPVTIETTTPPLPTQLPTTPPFVTRPTTTATPAPTRVPPASRPPVTPPPATLPPATPPPVTLPPATPPPVTLPPATPPPATLPPATPPPATLPPATPPSATLPPATPPPATLPPATPSPTTLPPASPPPTTLPPATPPPTTRPPATPPPTTLPPATPPPTTLLPLTEPSLTASEAGSRDADDRNASGSKTGPKSSTVAFSVGLAAVLLLALAAAGRKAMESFDRRHYTRLELNDLHYDL